MFGFWIKKSFFDMWDNLLPVILVNLGFYAVGGLVIGGWYGLAALGTALSIASSNLGLLLANIITFAFMGALVSLYSGATGWIMRKISDYEKPGFADFREGLKTTWRPSLVFGLVQGVFIALILNAANIYLATAGNLLHWLLFFVLFWFYLTWLMASQYFCALQARFDRRVAKNVRKMFILFFDNTLFTIFGLSLVSVITLGLSFFIGFIIPGFAGLSLLQAAALKLRALKYDYLDAHPGGSRKKIPWKTILAEDRERVGRRTLKGMFMPWKD